MSQASPSSIWRLVALASAAPWVAPAGLAQGGGPPVGPTHWTDVDLSAPPGFGRTACGDLDGDLVPDLVLARNGALELLVGPGLFDVHLGNVQQAKSFGVCRSADGAREVLLAAGTGGLRELTLDRDLGTWSSQLLSSVWSQAILLEVDAPPGGPQCVFGVMADGRSVRRMTRSATGWLDQLLFVLPVPAFDLELAQFDGVGPLEIWVATSGALAVFDQGGALRASWVPGGISSVAIGRLEQASDARDWIAWLVTLSSGWQELRAVGQAGVATPAGMSPTPSIVAMQTGDVDGDGQGDVVLSHTALHHLVVFLDRGDGTAPVFDYSLPDSLYLVPIGPANTPAPDNRARPTLTDVDGDGDSDTLMPVQSSGTVFLGRNPQADENALAPRVDLDDPLLASNLSALGNGELALDLRLAIDEPLPLEATHVELILWRRPCPQDPTEVVACDRALVPLDAATTAGGVSKLIAQLILPPPPDLIPGTLVRFEGIYVWLQRSVRVEGGEVVRCWPARVYALETSTSWGNQAWMYSLGGHPSFSVHEKTSGGTLPDEIGCGSELPCLPNFPAGQLPKWI